MESGRSVKSNESSSFFNIIMTVFTMFFVVHKNYFLYYRTKAVIGVVGGTSFFVFLTRDNEMTLIIAALLFVSFLELTDHYLWKYSPFSWMYITENFSGTYKGRQTNLYFSEFKESFYKKEKIFKEYKENFDLTLVVHQTGSIIKVSFFYIDSQDKNYSKFECDQVVVSKTDDKQHFVLTCHHGDIGVLENGGHHETIVLKFIKKDANYHIEGGCYDNRKLQARGKFINLKKVSSSKNHPF